jgi:hypothetical protein
VSKNVLCLKTSKIILQASQHSRNKTNNNHQKLLSMKNTILVLLTTIVVFASCDKDHGRGIFKGPVVKVFDGKAWTWIELDQDGNPMRAAITINADALSSVGSGDGHHLDANNTVLEFHHKAGIINFKHAWLNWNPSGHPPPGIYNLPHFDFHFYTVTSQERETYVDTAKLNADPATGYIPVNHLGVDPIPAMGKHFVDITSPEFNGQPFTQTFVYGSYNSKVIFFEPMITLDFLKNTTSFERPIPQPARFQKTGYYPTKMRVENSNGAASVILEGFVLRQAS